MGTLSNLASQLNSLVWGVPIMLQQKYRLYLMLPTQVKHQLQLPKAVFTAKS